jgi:hypothetical protein
MRIHLTCLISVLLFLFLKSPAQMLTPAEVSGYTKVTSWDDLSDFIRALDESSDLLKTEVIGASVEGRSLYALKFSSADFGADPLKVRVLILAQQHGNEQSGKEGALLLVRELLRPENRYFFNHLDLAIIPQMNPDGSEMNRRRNSHDADLNRNHLILTEPEVQALHRFFDHYQFEVSLDVHEYSPFGEEWEKFGYHKNAAETLGVLTNPNIDPDLRAYSKNEALPFFLGFLADRKFSSFEYTPGGPPGVSYFRHSTFDRNDGRQSFGIQQTLSFIQEGMNGADMLTDNLRSRTWGQMTGMKALLEFIYQHADTIQELVNKARSGLISGETTEMVSIQSDHTPNGKPLRIPLCSYSTGRDSMVIADDYRPVVTSLLNVHRPLGYLIPLKNKELCDWVKRQDLITAEYQNRNDTRVEQYRIVSVDSVDFEGDRIALPKVSTSVIRLVKPADYLYIPLPQQKGILTVLALEPGSMLGLATYPLYSHLMLPGSLFPALRVVEAGSKSVK